MKAALWPDQDLQIFNEQLWALLEDEKLMVSGGSCSRRMVDRAGTALSR